MNPAQKLNPEFARLLRRCDFTLFKDSVEWLAVCLYLELARASSLEILLSQNDHGLNRYSAGEIHAIDTMLTSIKTLETFKTIAEEQLKHAGKDQEEEGR